MMIIIIHDILFARCLYIEDDSPRYIPSYYFVATVSSSMGKRKRRTVRRVRTDIIYT